VTTQQNTGSLLGCRAGGYRGCRGCRGCRGGCTGQGNPGAQTDGRQDSRGEGSGQGSGTKAPAKTAAAKSTAAKAPAKSRAKAAPETTTPETTTPETTHPNRPRSQPGPKRRRALTPPLASGEGAGTSRDATKPGGVTTTHDAGALTPPNRNVGRPEHRGVREADRRRHPRPARDPGCPPDRRQSTVVRTLRHHAKNVTLLMGGEETPFTHTHGGCSRRVRRPVGDYRIRVDYGLARLRGGPTPTAGCPRWARSTCT